MRRADTARLVSLAAIWGASFLFNRIVAPSLGPVSGFNPEWRRWWRQYVVVGILTSAVPFLL